MSLSMRLGLIVICWEGQNPRLKATALAWLGVYWAAWLSIDMGRTAFRDYLHLVWVTKYRKPVLGERSGACAGPDPRDLRGLGRADHQGSREQGPRAPAGVDPAAGDDQPSGTAVEGETAYKLLQESAHLRKEFWGRHVWARGYFCCSSGNVTDEVVAAYIENQGVGHGGDFRVEGGPE